MTSESVLVIDAGSSRLRCHLFDHEGRIVSSSEADWEYVDEQDAPSIAKAFDPQWLWDACCKAIGRCLADASADAETVACVAVTSQRQAVVFLDWSGDEIYAGPNLDLRAVFEGAAIDEEYREQIYRVTGHIPSFLFSAAKLRWFQQLRPEAYANIATVLTLADWLAWRLTGVLASEVTLAGEAGLLDVGSRQWCNGLLGELGLKEQTTILVRAGEVVGRLTGDSAKRTGLAEGVPVTIAGADTQCGLLGMGVTEAGQVGIVAGWSAPVQMVTDRPIFDERARTWVGCHLIEDRWVAESSAGATGNAYQWMADTLYGDSARPFETMAVDAATVDVGANGSYAMMGSGAMNASSVGMTYGGLMFPVPLTTATGGLERRHLARAALESIAYAIRANVEQLESVTSQMATSISLGGGMTRTDGFARILADVIGRDILVGRHPDVTARGAYLCAKTAIGYFENLSKAAEVATADMETIRPRASDVAGYEDYYQGWTRLSDSLRSIDL